MPTGGSVPLFRVLGIRIGASPSWFVVLFVFIWLLSGRFQAILDGSDTEAFAVAVASALLVFGSILLHELGHALEARRHGIEVAGVDLWFFGGIAKLSRDSRSPKEELLVAAAGPAVTIALFGLCLGVGSLVSGDFVDAVLLRDDASVTPVTALLAFLVTVNAALFLFNLVPAFPLDGGRIARAAAWALTKDRLKATRVAAWLGQAFSWALIGLGLYLFIVADDPINGLWFGVLGWLLGQSARGAVAQSAFSERIADITVADVMDAQPVTVPAGLGALEAEETFFLRYGWDWFAAVDEQGRFVGLLHRDAVQRALADGRPTTPVGELVDGSSTRARVGVEQPLESLLGSESLRENGALFAVDGDGVLHGVVTADQVRRALVAAGPGRVV